mmetsp:Transcript_10469/g.36831  ORF Transcript_10469/g.36831 Transcript_10469/m.36831 type:complete len:710 (+) Transcript_10469:291-2420(+)
MHVQRVVSSGAQALGDGGLEDGRQCGGLGAGADLDLASPAGHGDLRGDHTVVARRRRHVQQQGAIHLTLRDIVHVVEGEIPLHGLGIHAVGVHHRVALPGVAHPLPDRRELVARHGRTLHEHGRQVEGHVEVEDIQRVLDRHLQEERVRRLRAREQLPRNHRQRGLGRRARRDVGHDELLRGREAEGVLVDLNREAVERHRGGVREGHVKLHLPALAHDGRHGGEAGLARLSCLRRLKDRHLREGHRPRRGAARGGAAVEVEQIQGTTSAPSAAAPVAGPVLQLVAHRLAPLVAVLLVVLVLGDDVGLRGGRRGGGHAGHELVLGLVVDAAHHGEILAQFVQEALLDDLRVVTDRRLVAENHTLRGFGVGGEQPPIDVAAVPDVVVIRLLCGELEHLGDHVLSLLGLLQKELHDAGEQLQLHHRGLVVEVVEEGIQDLINLVDALGILSQDPNHRGLGLRLVQFLQVVAERFEHLLVPRRVLAEDVLDDDTGLLHDVVHLRLDQLQQHGDGPLASALELHGDAADGAHGLPHEVYIDARGVLLEFQQDLFEVLFRDEHHHDVHLLQLDVHRVVVLAEEHLDVRGEDAGALLDDEANVPQDDILDLRLAREQGDQRRVQLLGQGAERLCVVDVLHAREDDLDGRQHHRGVGVRQPRGDALGDGLRIARARGHVDGEGVQDENLAPLVALVEGRQELGDRGFVFQVQQVLS